MFNIELVTATVGLLKDALHALGYSNTKNAKDVKLVRIDLGREMEMTMRTTMVKDYFGGEHYPKLDPNLIHIVIKKPPTETTTSVTPATDK